MRLSMMALPKAAMMMTLSISIISSIISNNINMAQAQIMPGARGLTIEECLNMISTETDEEFDYDKSDPTQAALASRLWSDANSFEWQKAAMAESTSHSSKFGLGGQKYPYLLCHIGKDANGNNLSGYRRSLALAQAIDANTVTTGGTDWGNTVGDTTATYNDDDDENKLYFRPLYNEDDYLCVYGQLLASVAAGITGDDFVVQPIVPSLKYMKGTVDHLEEEVEFADDTSSGGNGGVEGGWEQGYNPSLDILLCPGVAIADENDTETTQVWEDVPKETAADIIAQLVPKSVAVTTTAEAIAEAAEVYSISETYYLTSEQYFNATSNAASEELTSRSKLWRDVIEQYQVSGKCDDTYMHRLKWTIHRAKNPETESSMLNVEFNTTGDKELDAGCMLTLSLGIAAHPNVCSLESRERVSTSNKVIQWLTQSEIKEERPFFDVGLDGGGQVVAVSDTGADQDSCYFYDPDSEPNSNFVNLNARKIAQYVDFVDNADYQYGHGTHVAGTIAGKRLDGPGMADGIAPGAKIAFADIGDRNGNLLLPLDQSLLNVGAPYAKIHSASWGSEINFYTTQARNFDQYMYDNDEFLILVAAGNSGHGDAANTVGSPATAKNIIAVGAHHNTGSSSPDFGLGPNYVADFSSRGPTIDGRTKPDMLAPGKAVLSAGAQPDQLGECDPGKVPGSLDKSEGVLSLQGTSMATPVVSGTAAIVRQYFEQGYYPTGVKNENDIMPNPSGALIKAVLMNGAQFMNGVDNGGSGVTDVKPYDNNQNFGRLALQYSVYIPGKTDVNLMVWDRQVVYDQNSQSHNIQIDRSGGCTNENLSVTLVWTEPGSSPGCTACVLNDLDLTVEVGGKKYYPNGFENHADRVNNAERVIINGVQDGAGATITVTGYNLIQRYQIYSLVATGCFEGSVANQNFVKGCSAFDCDDSEDERLAKILMAIFIPLGVCCLCGLVGFLRRRKQASNSYDDEGP